MKGSLGLASSANDTIFFREEEPFLRRLVLQSFFGALEFFTYIILMRNNEERTGLGANTHRGLQNDGTLSFVGEDSK